MRNSVVKNWKLPSCLHFLFQTFWMCHTFLLLHAYTAENGRVQWPHSSIRPHRSSRKWVNEFWQNFVLAKHTKFYIIWSVHGEHVRNLLRRMAMVKMESISNVSEILIVSAIRGLLESSNDSAVVLTIQQRRWMRRWHKENYTFCNFEIISTPSGKGKR